MSYKREENVNMDISNFTDKAREVLTGSSSLAMQNQHAEITSYHLVHIMLENKNNRVYQLLVKMDVETEKFKEANDEELNALPSSNGSSAMRFSRDVEQVLAEAERTSKSMHEDFIAPEHIFLGVLDYAPENLRKLFKFYQINKRGFLGAIKDVKNTNVKLEVEDEEKHETDFEFLSKFGKNLTELAKENKLEPVIGRDDEIRNVIRILTRKTKNNPVLIGEPRCW
jgi:ATP-dependent Clp protease ATP-binding subunit ClpB